MERFRVLWVAYTRGAHFFFLVYDTTKRDTFNILDTFYSNLQKDHLYNDQGVAKPIAIIGTKLDVDSDERVEPWEVEQWI